MNNIYKNQLEILRQRIPVGVRHGLILLEKTDGDLEKAEIQFQEEMITQIIHKTEVTKETATRYLKQNNFDIPRTLKSIDEDRYTLTELILRKFKDKKEEALDKIMIAVEEKHHLKRKFWLIFDDLKELDPVIYCFLTSMEWLNYESWESYGTALSFNLETVCEQFEKTLELHDLSFSLRQAKDIQKMIDDQHKTNEGIQNYITANNELQNNRDYLQCEAYFIAQRPVLIDRLYELVKNNMDKFP